MSAASLCGGEVGREGSISEEIMLDWIHENPSTPSEASGHGVKEWSFFLQENTRTRAPPGLRSLGYSPGVRYLYVQPRTSESEYFLKFLDARSRQLLTIEPPSVSLLNSEFRSPSEADLFLHLEGFGTRGPDGSSLSADAYAQLLRDLSAVESFGTSISGWLDPSLMTKIRVPSQTSPGLRWKKLGYKTKRAALMPALIEATKIVKDIQEKSAIYTVPPCGVAGRGKRVEYRRDGDLQDSKDGRLIVMPDLVRHLIGSMASQPLMGRISKIDKSKGGIMLGMGPFSGQFEELAGHAAGASSYVLLDFTKFDQRIPALVLREALRHISSKFENVPGKTAYFRSEFNQIVNTIIAMPDGTVWQKRRGIASGDPWTSIIGSYCNWIMLQYVTKKLGWETKIWAFGDDSVIAVYNRKLDNDALRPLSRLLYDTFGMVVSERKSYVTDTLVDIADNPEPRKSGSFLSNYFYHTEMGVRVTRPLEDLYELMIHPERNRGTVEWEVVRTSAMYLNFYYNEDARYLLEEYWDYLHKVYRIPELRGSSMDYALLREMDLPWDQFKLVWLNRLPFPGEIELLYKYGHSNFYPPSLWAAWYHTDGSGIYGNQIVCDPRPPAEGVT